MQARAAERDKALASEQGSARELRAKLDGAIAENEQLRKELARLGTNADTLLAEKGSLASALADAKARLEELRRAQAAADARAALFKQLALKFQKMIDAGELKVALRNGRMVLELPERRALRLRTDGDQAGGQAGAHADRRRASHDLGSHFQVAGDTDNVPIDTPQFPSNWELSTGRAVQVVHFLLGQGMQPESALRRWLR